MKIFIALAGLLLWAAPLLAETYSWVDENGTYNFTEDYSRVPKKYRGGVVKQGDMGASPSSKASVAPSTGDNAASPEAPGSVSAGKQKTSLENPAAKSVYQWRQELSEREAAMWAIRKRVDEIDTLLKTSPPAKEQVQSLVAERNRVVEQFAELRKQYDQQVELARKAGIQVDITQQP